MEDEPVLNLRGTAAAGRLPDVGVHVLSEHVFCPRAGLLALESGEDNGDVEPNLGPRLDGVVDYDAHRFAEELRAAWDQLRLWLTLMAPAILLVFVVWRLISPLAGVAAALPAVYLLGQMWEGLMRIVQLVRERSAFEAAPLATIDSAPAEVQEVNWWSLRKAGFDCLEPVDAHRDPGRRLHGKPWRVLTKGTTLRIPVVRKHRGERTWGRQHIVRLAAYCQLIETCEGGDAPFGVLMFAGSYDCLMIPITAEAQEQFKVALEEVRDFLRKYEEKKRKNLKMFLDEPTDNRCQGCHFGRPRRHAPGSATILDGKAIDALPTRAVNGQDYHCDCGDRFNWVPPHKDAVQLEIARPR